MDFTYTDDQKMLKDAARRFLAGACPNVEWYLELEKDKTGFSQELWRGMAELGWMAILIPEEYNGIGGNMIDIVTLMEEMGYAAVPSQYFSTVILGGCTIINAGSAAQKNKYLLQIADGSLRMTMALNEPGMTFYNPSLIRVIAEKKADGYSLSGAKLFVPDVNVVDLMIVAARTSGKGDDRDGISLFIVDPKSAGIEITQLITTAGDKQFEVVFKDAVVTADKMLGELGKGFAVIEKTLEIASVAKSAEMLGGCNKVMELAVAYAKERIQFGKPIGSFQAVQHLCANMKMSTEQSIYITYKAAWMLANNMPEARRFASVAKAFVSEAYKKVAQIGHQVFGGTGYCVEHAMPIYSRRAKAAEYAFGNPAYHREIVAQELGL